MTEHVGNARTHATERRKLRRKLEAEGVPAEQINATIAEMRAEQFLRRAAAGLIPSHGPVPDVAPPDERLADGPGPEASQRPAIIGRDGTWCRYCGRPVYPQALRPSDRLTIDHVTPRSRGGSDWPTNRVVCCHPCNQMKGARTAEEWGRQLLPPRGPRAPKEAHAHV